GLTALADSTLIPFSNSLFRGQKICVVFGQAIPDRKSLAFCIRQLGKTGIDSINYFPAYCHRHKVRLRKVPVIVGFFLCPHRLSNTRPCIPEPRLLLDITAFLQHFCLAPYLIFQRPFYKSERIHIFQLRLDPELCLPDRAQGHIGIASERTLFHITVTHFEIPENAPYLFHVLGSFFGASDIRL